MRFTRYGRCEFTDTQRKRAAIRHKQRREREALPLFAEPIASEQPAEDDVMARPASAGVAPGVGEAASLSGGRAPVVIG